METGRMIWLLTACLLAEKFIVADSKLGCTSCIRQFYPAEDGIKDTKQICQLYTDGLKGCGDCDHTDDPLLTAAYIRNVLLDKIVQGCFEESSLIDETPDECVLPELCILNLFDQRTLSCDKEEVEGSLKCLVAATKICPQAERLIHILQAAVEDHCDGPGCLVFSPLDTITVYRTVPNTDCKNFTITDQNQVIHGPRKTQPGTAFDASAGFCVVNHIRSTKCFN